MLFLLLTLLLALNAGWMVGVVLPDAQVDWKARLLAGAAGGAVGTLLFERFGPTLSSVVASILCALLAGVAAVVSLRSGAGAWKRRPRSGGGEHATRTPSTTPRLPRLPLRRPRPAG